jgi:hypothetical protein
MGKSQFLSDRCNLYRLTETPLGKRREMLAADLPCRLIRNRKVSEPTYQATVEYVGTSCSLIVASNAPDAEIVEHNGQFYNVASIEVPTTNSFFKRFNLEVNPFAKTMERNDA